MADDLRERFDQARADVIRSQTVAEYEEAMARADALAEELRERDKREGLSGGRDPQP